MDFIEMLALAAFITGLLCRRLSTALIVGGTLALAYAVLVTIGLWQLLPDANLVYLGAALAVACLLILLPTVLACLVRRRVEKLLGRRITGLA
jgi:mannose/fructose/N-acetylgalactosamine-specific phosphotransferase system component IIC